MIYCYEGNCCIGADPDDESTGAPVCDGKCENCGAMKVE
jgi:hypothetical protein